MSNLSGNTFSIICPTTGITQDSYDCGVSKSIPWTTNGTLTNVQSFYLQYSTFNHLVPVYVFIEPKIKKLLNFTFTPVSNNNSNITVNIKQKINGIFTIVSTQNLGTLATTTTKNITLYFDANNKDDVSLTLDVITSGGTSGSFTCTIDCNPSIISAEFCTGFTSSSYYCTTCPTVVTLYRTKTPTLPSISGITDINSGFGNFTPFQTGPWYLDSNLSTEAPTGVTYSYAVGDVSTRSTYTYDQTSHSFVLQSSCLGSVVGCSDTVNTLTHNLSGYTNSHPFLPTVSTLKSTGLKYSVQDITSKLDTKSRIVPITITITGQCSDASFIISDGVNNEHAGQISYSLNFGNNTVNPYFYGGTDYSSIKIPMTKWTYVQNFQTYTTYIGTKTIYAVTNSGQIRVRIAIGQSKSYNGSSVSSTVKIGCGNPIYSYDMGVHPYSAYDSYNSPTVVTKIYSDTSISSWSGSTSNYSIKGTRVYNDSLFLNQALPYFYADNIRTSNTNKVYQIGNIIKREFGTHTDYRVTKKLFGPRKISDIIKGPKDWTNLKNDGTEILIAGENLVPTAIEPIMNGVGYVHLILGTSDYLQPTVYKYHVGYTSGYTATNSNDYFFTKYDFSKKTNTPLTGFEHCTIKMNKGYATGTGIPEIINLWTDGYGQYIALGLIPYLAGYIFDTIFVANLFPAAAAIEGGGIVGLAANLGAGLGGNVWLTGWSLVAPIVSVVVAAAAVIAAIYFAFFWDDPMNFIEKFEYFYTRYSTKPYITTGTTIYTKDDLSTWNKGIYDDGAYYYTIPSGSTDGKVTSKSLSYTIASGATRNSIDVVDTTKTNYIVDFSKLFFLSYTAGFPIKFTTTPTLYMSNSLTYTLTQPSSVIGALNNPIPVVYTLPSGFTTSTISQADADNQATSYFTSLTGNTNQNFYSYEEKPGITDLQMSFTHEIKVENDPNYFIINYDNSNASGITINKTLYHDVHGDSSVLNGYYSVAGNNPYRKMYKTVNGVVTDILIWQNASDTTVTSSTTGTHNIVNYNLDYTSGWYFASHNLTALGINLNSPDENIIANWNTDTFYTGTTTGITINKGFIKSRKNPTSFRLYDNNLTGTTHSEAPDSSYREIFPFNSSVFTYHQPVTLNINAIEICDFNANNNGVNFYITDSNGNTVTSYVGITFNANVYQNGSLLTGLTITIDSNSTSNFQYLNIPSSGNTITGFTISNYVSSNPYNNVTFTQGTFTASSGVTICSYYYHTEYSISAPGYIEYMVWNATGDTKVYEYISSTGVYVQSNPYQYGSLKTSQSMSYTPNAAITIEYIGDCFTPPTPTPTPTNTVTPTVTPTNTVTPTQTPTPTFVHFSDITSDPKTTAAIACSSIYFNPDNTVGDNSTFCNSTTLTNPSYGQLATGTYFISYGSSYVRVSITNGNNTATVTSAL